MQQRQTIKSSYLTINFKDLLGNALFLLINRFLTPTTFFKFPLLLRRTLSASPRSRIPMLPIPFTATPLHLLALTVDSHASVPPPALRIPRCLRLLRSLLATIPPVSPAAFLAPLRRRRVLVRVLPVPVRLLRIQPPLLPGTRILRRLRVTGLLLAPPILGAGISLRVGVFPRVPRTVLARFVLRTTRHRGGEPRNNKTLTVELNREKWSASRTETLLRRN